MEVVVVLMTRRRGLYEHLMLRLESVLGLALLMLPFRSSRVLPSFGLT